MPDTPGPITRLARAVNEVRLSATVLIESSIERIQSVDPQLNVMAERAFDDALAAAHLAEREGHPHGPLAGTATLIKDLEDCVATPTRKGSLALRDVPPASQNGVVPQRLLDAGAIAVGQSTLRSSPSRATPPTS